MFDSIIFDLDGTLWDATENITLSWNEAIREKYPDRPPLLREDFFAQMGRLLPDIGKSLFSDLTEQAALDLVERCCSVENSYLAVHGGRLYHGMEKTLEQLSQKYKLFIVSNCQSGYIEAFFASSGLQKYFADIECSGNTGLVKAQNIRLIAERNSLKTPVYVGDTSLDGESADQAGVPFIWAAYGFGRAQSFLARLDAFEGLPELLDTTSQ